MSKKESNKTPEEVQRSKIRRSVKNLADEREKSLESIVFWKKEIEKIERYYLCTPLDEVSENIQKGSEESLDAEFLRRTHSSADCVWFGYEISGIDRVFPKKGSYGYKVSLFRKPHKPCTGQRNPLDVYCNEHRLLANQVLSQSPKPKYPHLAKEHPIPFWDVNQEKGTRIGSARAVREHFELKHREYSDIVEKKQKRIREIDIELAKLRDRQASIESGLKRKKLPEHTRLSIYKKYDFKCANCKVDLTIIAPHIDHIVPLAKGGQDILSNLQPLCGPCNLKKGSKYEE